MPVLKNIGTIATCAASGGQADIHEVKDAAIAWRDGKIEWVGNNNDLPAEFEEELSWDAHGKLLIPGLIDCHTHLAFAGSREKEFEMRLLGKSYLEIAKAGGGILSTVKAVRSATEDELFTHCLHHTKEIAALGITTIECKSGYGLNLEDELKTLRAYRRLAVSQPVEIVPTLLAAHAIPEEYKDKRADYVRLIIERIIPRVAEEKLAEFCDAFVEESAFTADEAREIMAAAKEHGLGVRLHVDQLTNKEGASLAAELGAMSADHLEHISEKGITALKARNVVGVILPLASLYTDEKPLNARALVEAGVKVAVATNYNPGSAPSFHLPLAMTLSCAMNHLTPAEALKGATINAAKVLKRDSDIGSLEPGKKADFALIDAKSVNEWLFYFRPNACAMTVKNGRRIFG